MRVFIMEDDGYKLENIVGCLQTIKDIEIKTCKYYNESLGILSEASLTDKEFDYAILDNNVPRFADLLGDMVINCAEDTVSWLELMDIPTKCIVLSSDSVKFEEKHDNCVGIIKYDSTAVDWEFQLLKLLKQ